MAAELIVALKNGEWPAHAIQNKKLTSTGSGGRVVWSSGDATAAVVACGFATRNSLPAAPDSLIAVDDVPP
jgi:hypothetical protein